MLGRDATLNIRAWQQKNKVTNDIEIVMLTANASACEGDGDREGFNSKLVKPITVLMLKSVLESKTYS